MTIRIKLDKNILDPKNKKAILSPDEITDHTVVKKTKQGKYIFYLPFRVDIVHSIKNELEYELEIINDNKKQNISLLNPELLSPTSEQLDTLNLLPGQINYNAGDVNERIKKRNIRRKIENESFSKTEKFDNEIKSKRLKKRFSKKFSQKNKSLTRKQQIIKNKEDNKNILKNINDGDHVIRNVVMFNKTRTIKKRRIDYTKKVSNNLAKKIKKSKSVEDAKKLLPINSKVLFGLPNNPGIDMSSAMFYSIPKVGKDTMIPGGDKRININNRDKMTPPGGPSNSKPGSKNIKNNFLKQYQKRVDPAIFFEGVATHRSVMNVKRGTLPKIGIKRTGKKGKGLVFKNMNIAKSLRQNYVDKNLILANKIVGTKGTVNQGVGRKGTFELKKPNKRDKLPFAYIEKVVKDYELIYYKYDLDQSHILQNKKINMQLNIYNSKGLKVADKLFSISPGDIIAEQSIIPDAMPTLNITKDKNKNFISVEIINSSNSTMNYKLFRKFIDSSRTENRRNQFEQIDQGIVKNKGNVRKRLQQVTNLDCLFRLTCQIKEGAGYIEYSNFSNETLILMNENDIKKDVTLNTSVIHKINTRSGIQITVSNIPPDVQQIKMLRRNTSLCNSLDSSNRMQKMEYVKDVNDASIIQKYFVGNQSEITFFDNQVRDDNVYEYQAEMVLERGTKKRSSNRVREEYIDKDSAVAVDNFEKVFRDSFISLADIFYSNSDQNIVKVSSAKKGKNESFNFSTGRTQTDMLVSRLTNQANKGLYDKELEEIKDFTNIITGVNIVLKNKTNGDTHEVGDINTGDSLANFINQVKSNSRVEMSYLCEYELIVKGYELSPQESIEKLTKLIKSPEANRTLAGKLNKNSSKKRAIMTKLSKNLSKGGQKFKNRAITKKRSKFFQKRSLKRGTITSGVGPEATIAKGKTLRGSPNVIAKHYTGDILTIPFSKFLTSNCLMSPISTYASPYHNVVVTFNLKTNNISNIDFIIITAEKDGISYPVGSAHVINENITSVSYLDYTNVDYLGYIEYYGQAVYVTGGMSSRQKIGEVLLVHKFDESNI